MKKLRVLATVLFVLATACATVKTVSLSDKQLKANLKKHISTLASDQFEGRETGTKGEQLAADYIVTQFKEIGLKPKGEKEFIQNFPFTEGANIGKGTQLYVNANSYKVNQDFYPLQSSSSGIVTGYIARVGYGIYAPFLRHNDYDGKTNLTKKIFVIESSYPESKGAHNKFSDYDLRQRVEFAKMRGATAVIFINSDTTADNPESDFIHRFTQTTIPVIFAKGDAAKLLKEGVVTNCTVGVDIQKIEKKGHNIIGCLNNNANTTVVIGAHYDHLGYGGEGSLYSGEPAIHHGADDNASGTAALIELARALKASSDKKNNYLFIALSGEEKGLLGSDYFVKHPTIDMKAVNYMINIDMVGRLKSGDEVLNINGIGTSPAWITAFDTSVINHVKIKTTISGVGPSDQTSFYLDSIPALQFSSGIMSGYHTTEDTENKINYDGEVSIVRIIMRAIDRLNNSGKIAFQKTDNAEVMPKLKVPTKGKRQN